jgi:hypothetical protein
MEGYRAGFGAVQINYGSECGFRRLKNIRNGMRIRKTAINPVVADVFVVLFLVSCLEFLLMLVSMMLLASLLFMAYLFF